jgi:hypothetical protein
MLVIKVGKTPACKLKQLEDLRYSFGVRSPIECYNYGYDSYGEDLCFAVNDNKILSYSSLEYYKRKYNDLRIVTLDKFLEMNVVLVGKYIVAKIDNGYRVLKLESDHYVICSDNTWKELDWAISEKEVMENMEKNDV